MCWNHKIPPPKGKDHFYQKALQRAPFKLFWNLQSSHAFDFILILQTYSRKIPADRQPEKYILTELNVKKGSPKTEISSTKEKITFIKKALRRAPYILFWNLQSSRAFDFNLVLQTYSRKISVAYRPEKYIKTELNVKTISLQSENSSPKGKDHFYQKGPAKGSF
jgi:hypothetical protein